MPTSPTAVPLTRESFRKSGPGLWSAMVASLSSSSAAGSELAGPDGPGQPISVSAAEPDPA